MSLNLVIGCGGSGLTTIQELNRLLAQDPEMLPRIPKEVFYLVLDTKKADLENFEAALAEQMGDYPGPFTKSVLLSRDTSILSDAFRVPFKARYEGVKGDPGQARLKEHWWHDENGLPFLAPEVTNLIDGAGQCPPASYGLAWYRLKEIGEAVVEIVDEMVDRGNGSPERLKELKVTVVAGLAGGTGRGTWSLVTFKVREYLLDKYHVTVPPLGMFFDANVFENVAKEHQGQTTALKVNALTGLSELSCWMTNGGKSGEERYAYRLPSIESPENPMTDVLKVDLEVNPKSGGPVGGAFLVCGANQSAKLSTNGQYHAMAGAALYVLATNPDVSGVLVNDTEPYKSLAAATFEVDALHIRQYFETRARGFALEGLATGTAGAEAEVSAFLAECPLAARVRTAEDLKPNARGTVYQRAALALQGKSPYKESLATLKEDLRGWNKQEAEEETEDLLAPADPALAQEAIADALAGFGPKGKNGLPTGLGGEGAAAAVAEAAKRVYRGEGGQKPSVARARAFLEGLKAEIEKARKEAPTDLKVGTEVSPAAVPGEAAKKTLEVYGKRSAIEFVKGVGVYNEDEIGKLCEETSGGGYWGVLPKASLAASYPVLKAALEEALAGALVRIGKLIAGCKRFEDCCSVAREAFGREEGEAAGGARGENAFRLLFATPDRVEETLCQTGDKERVYHRKLVPVVKSEDELAGLGRGAVLCGSGLTEFITKSVDSGRLEALGEEGNEDLRSRFTRDLVKAVRTNVRLKEGFMADHFTFPMVLAENLKHWNATIADAQGDGVRMQRLCDMFLQTLGTVPRIDEQDPEAGPKLPDVEEVRLRIAASLAAKCSPWWIADTDQAKHAATVYVPFASGSQAKDGDSLKKIQDSDLLKKVKKAVAEHADFKLARGTPYAYVSFVWAGLKLKEDEERRGVHLLDKVTSLGYYGDPDVMRWMRMAESEDGESIFLTRNGNKGIGYVSPIYVKDKKLSGYRWKPWMKNDVAIDEVARNQALGLMLYAMLGMGLSSEQAKAFAEKLAPYGVRLPVLKQSATGQKWTLSRKTLEWSEEDGKAVANIRCAWNAEKQVCTSVCNLDTLLRGKGRTGKGGEPKDADVADGLKLKELLETELRMFEEHVRAELGAAYRDLCRARTAWLQSQRDNADKEDLEVFNALLERSTRR
ncbi:MAG: hypothetical protein IK066_07345 [Kiritimatiellae bacterium]|nr:hypothetical protein [Kiritimatiellia bacterium]